MVTPAVLVGQAIGDALGMPFEKPKDEVHPDLATWDGSYKPGTWHKLPAGHWTDDTEMAVALAGSLIDNEGCFLPADVAKSYLLWFQGTPHGAGSTTKKAMANLANGERWERSGIEILDRDAVGAGTAMRVAPLGVLYRPSSTLYITAGLDAYITHQSIEALDGSTIVALLVSLIISARGRDDIADLMPKVLDEKVLQSNTGKAALLAHQMAHSGPSEEEAIVKLGRRGNVTQIVSSAIYLAQRYSGRFEEGVTAAVKAGGDADTRAAIVGAILGAEVGLEGIPSKYLAGLHEVEMLKRMDAELLALRQ